MNDIQIEFFIRAAECRSFSKAAKQLYVSSSTISRNVASLEDELGVTLFIRTNQNITLTLAGELIYKWMLKTREEYNGMISKARSINSSSKKVLRIGIPAGQMLNPAIQRTLERLNRESEATEIILHRSYGKGLTGLFGGDFDLVATLSFKTSLETAQLNCLNVCSLETFLILPKTHRLAGKHTRSLADFKNETFILFPKHPFSDNHNTLLEIFKEAALLPPMRVAPDSEAYSLWIEAGWGIGIGNIDHITCNTPSLTEIHVPELAQYPTNFLLLWKKSNRNPEIGRFLKLLREEIQSHG